MRVGILGGTFNPPHIGHLHISKVALNTMQLDAIWWMVTPQNPLKPSDGLPSVEERVKLSKALIDHPKILVTGIEQNLSSTFTYETVRTLKKRFPCTEFAWITGMDNAHNLHLWQHWKDLLQHICMIHITRHPPVKLIKSCPLRMLSSQKHITVNHGGCYPLDSQTTYWLLQKKMINISSTEIREKMLSNTKG